jgi:hypothetical protein
VTSRIAAEAALDKKRSGKQEIKKNKERPALKNRGRGTRRVKQEKEKERAAA